MVLKHTYAHSQGYAVLDPYKLTWFSNIKDGIVMLSPVLDPYKLTWFSNKRGCNIGLGKVLDPYKLTWFSNSNYTYKCGFRF